MKTKTPNLHGIWILGLAIAAQQFLSLEAVPVGKIAEDTSGAATDSGNQVSGSDDSDIETINSDLGDTVTRNEDEIIFEGDIVTNLEKLREFYDIDEEMEKELLSLNNVSNASRIKKQLRFFFFGTFLWTNWRVPYEINSSFSENDVQTILRAMESLTNNTCLSFVQRTTERDYVHFENGTVCSSYIGRTIGRQYITLAPHCRTHSIVLHEIGHALGLWHEHSRPDRDSYVTIHWNNIIPRYITNFWTQLETVIDYQGTGYDYGSVMHYRRTSGSINCSDCYTISVNNETEYERQGRPILGRAPGLSATDIIEINRLYNCPAPGQQGLLMFYIRYGHNLHNYRYPRLYVRIEAVTSAGNIYTKRTTNRRIPTWNEALFFNTTTWQLFRIRVWYNHGKEGRSETVPLLDKPRASNMNKHCMNTECSRYVVYDYKLLGIVHGRLEVRLRETPKISSAESGSQQPTVTVTAISPDGSSSYTLKSNRWVTMKGCSFAENITVDIEGAAVQTRGSQLIDISQIPTFFHTYCLPDVSFLCRTYAPQRLDVRLIPDGDECQPNPCLNGGTCTDGCATYSCSCPDSFTGNRCQNNNG